LIIGAGGFLGQHIARKAASAFDVFQAGTATPPARHGLVRHIAMDITSAASVTAGFEQAAPDAAILLAAISDIDECERRPDLAQAVNVVFDGARHGYRESDPPTPLSVYGSTKALAEEAILRKLPSALVLRLALVIGFAEGSGTNAMLNKFAARLRTGESVSLPGYEYRNPIDAETLSCFVLELLHCGAAGIFHVGATESISRFELGVRLAEKMGFSLDGRAPRGPDHFLLTGKLQAACRTPVPSCSEVIERAIHGSPQSNS
jgi:dTDP-4-dehydrorhamnose reductase